MKIMLLCDAPKACSRALSVNERFLTAAEVESSDWFILVLPSTEENFAYLTPC